VSDKQGFRELTKIRGLVYQRTNINQTLSLNRTPKEIFDPQHQRSTLMKDQKKSKFDGNGTNEQMDTYLEICYLQLNELYRIE
jgi:hypothetical protein